MPDFTHLHVHTQYSILDGAANVSKLISKAKEYGMDSLAITDHGNMYGVSDFFIKAKAQGIKPIIGCEIYVARESRFQKKGKPDRSGYHLILLAKNKEGYHNLSKLSSLGFIEGFYYTPRIDKEILKKYSRGLIACSACLGGEIPSAIINSGIEKAEEVLREHLEIFGEDFYLELMRGGHPEQETVNNVLLELSKKYNVKVIATNDVHFINKEDYEAHHILICLNTGKFFDDEGGMHYKGTEYLKSPEEMAELFSDIPEAITNTREVVDKIEEFDILEKNVILPVFPLPEGFDSEDEYLKHLAYEGAKNLYPELSEEIIKRLDYELSVIKDMGFAGYFLIVQDFIAAARNLNVIVGPGRGSAAGSAVAFCTQITNIDPIKYNLLFERFLNPDRVSMPDIDIDFDDEGREKVLKYVIDKYGEDRVAQIVTFGTMAARLSIRDVARVLRLPLPEADKLAKLVPERPGITLKKAYQEVKELSEARKKGSELVKKTLNFAETLEGSARHTGTHACGVIIGREKLVNYIPLSTAKDSELSVTQYEGKLVESVGMLKMDFLGLKTLSIIKDAIENIRLKHGVEIDINKIPLDDEKTFKLYQEGNTIGTFQFESEGMRSYLKNLKPTNIEDLIAMNALYRPGPMDFIPLFIDRKHGKEKVEYPHVMLENILKPTYGIMVYQEQIMQTAQIMGGFTLGEADLLRRAMGKKKMEIMEKQKVVFIAGAEKKGIDKENAAKVFQVMQKFAEYGFNRSHSAAYSVISYQTAYLKAHYTAEYMASVLTHNLKDIKKITFFIDESKRQGISVLGPDINESVNNFIVNKNGEIRFGMAAVKGVGEAAVNSLIQERNKKGFFINIFDFTKRVNLRTVNKKSLESLAMAGAFDSFNNTHRAQYFHRESSDDTIFLEKILKHASNYQSQKNSMQISLFGDEDESFSSDIELPKCEHWSKLQQLKFEKEVTGFYMSGHPLDNFKLEIKSFCNISISAINKNFNQLKNKTIIFAGIVTSVAHKTTKNGNPFGTFIIEDFSDSFNIALFGDSYIKNKNYIENEGYALLIKARIQEKRYDEKSLELKVLDIQLLPDAIEKFSREITLKFDLMDITDDIISKLSESIKANPGKCILNFCLTDNTEKKSLRLKPRLSMVNPIKFIKSIENLKNANIELNKIPKL